MFDLQGRKALITGASGAIGAAIARAMHKQGATVFLCGRNEENLKKCVHSLGSEKVYSLKADLNEDDQVEALVGQASEAMGGLDTLVNNAGITRDNLLMRLKLDDWRQVLKVNLEVSFRLSQAALRPMLKAQFGRILNITSVVGMTGNPGQTNYAASKAALMGFSKSLAQEVASRNITVNCIAPGFISSAMTDVLNDDQKAKINASIPVGKIGSPDDIGAAAVYLASQEAAYVTGQTLHVNGGMFMI